jgi:hypothetical protein
MEKAKPTKGSKAKKPSKSPAQVLHAADSLLGIVEVSEDK